MAQDENRILSAIEALHAEGLPVERITLRAVREKAGSGSFSTITAVLRKWKEGQAPVQGATLDMPEAVRLATERASTLIWSAAQGLAVDRIAAAERVATERVKSVEVELEEVHAELARLEGEHEALATRERAQAEELTRLREAHAQLRETHAAQDASLTAEREKTQALEARLAALEGQESMQARLAEMSEALSALASQAKKKG